MSFNNFSDINPLIAVYENNSRTTTSDKPYMLFDTSLYSGSISNDILTVDYPCTLRGDFYGSTTVSGSLSLFAHFYVNNVGQYQSREVHSDNSGGNVAANETFFANAPASVPIRARYRLAGTSSVTTAAKFPRITGVLTE